MVTYSSSDELASAIRNSIPNYPDWPKSGVNYLNTVELCKNPLHFGKSISWFCEKGAKAGIQDIFAADARGFLWGAPVANTLFSPLHVVRKPGKLPGTTWTQSYQLEYGEDNLELLANTPKGNRPVMIIDDVLATGGTAEAICKLLHDNLHIAYDSMTVAVLVNLTFLPGEKLLREKGIHVCGLINE